MSWIWTNLMAPQNVIFALVLTVLGLVAWRRQERRAFLRRRERVARRLLVD